jgi:uncharacterized tellurite resistance protein B-like protein
MSPHDGLHGEKIAQEIRYAAAALLVVCAKADFEELPEEIGAITKLLEETFGLSNEIIEELIEHVSEDTGVKGLDEFTRLVNQYYSEEDKLVLLENLWRVAYADGRIDKFEEQYISRVAFMIDVPQSQVKEMRRNAEN